MDGGDKKEELKKTHLEQLEKLNASLKFFNERHEYIKKQILIVPTELELLKTVLAEAEYTKCEAAYEKALQERDRLNTLFIEFFKTFEIDQNGGLDLFDKGSIEQMESVVKDDFSVSRQKLDELHRCILLIELSNSEIEIAKTKFELNRLKEFRDFLSGNRGDPNPNP